MRSIKEPVSKEGNIPFPMFLLCIVSPMMPQSCVLQVFASIINRHSTAAVMARQKRLPVGRLVPPAPSNRASGLVRAGKPSRPRSRSLLCVSAFVFEGQLSICHRHRRTHSRCSSCSTALADEPLLPSLHKLSPFAVSARGARSTRPRCRVGDAEVLPNTFGLPVAQAAEGKNPEHIVDQVEKALPKNEDRGCGAIPPRCAKQGLRTLASEIIDRLTSDRGSIIDVNMGQH
jgi:hypothetical protein